MIVTILGSFFILIAVKIAEFFYRKLPDNLNSIIKFLLSLGIVLLTFLMIVWLGVLFLKNTPAYKGFEAQARYNASKENFTNMKNLIMAGISKCNGNTTGNTFVDSTGTTQTLGAGAGACPLSTSATGQADAINYFSLYVNDRFKNPYQFSSKIVKDRITQIKVPGVKEEAGFVSITPTSGSTTSLTIMVNVGQAAGSTTYDVLQENISTVEKY